ncbi:MAG TPA: bifunctional serine/threonine-protein kinase/formylglycine-generating enzyme family protein, partial [Polyangiaceae bacterium]|nr:bifunctional serine/threonine-protein kinase/formylglycine-generating enzyme family protein [Polyangiaceae bacterium]
MTELDPLHIVGQIVADKYRIEKLVGEGGFAVVYRAQHTIWNKPVAIKFFNGLSSAPMSQRDLFQQAFVQEGALLTELSSQTAGIVQARDIGTYTTPDGSWMPFMVLEWLEGSSLEGVLEREQRAKAPPWTVEQVVRLLGQAARALDVAHTRGIAHRDVKPANLFVLGNDARSPDATLKVLDFGVAKMVTDNTQLQAALAKTGTSVTSFTPQYGAPEQFSRNLGATGPWTDVFALALVATELLTGRPALDGDDVVQLAVSASQPNNRPTPRSLGATVSNQVEAVFQKALAVKPTDRYSRAAEFWNALEAASGNLTRTQTQPNSAVIAPTELAENPLAAEAALRVTGANPTTGAHSTIATEARPSTRSNAPWLIAAAAAIVAVGAGVALSKNRDSASTQAPSAQVAAVSAAPTPPAPPPEPTCPERMVKIPRGQFFQGSDAKDARDNEKPAHQVSLDAFCVDLYEVTAGDYKACSDSGKCKRASTEVEWPGITPADKKVYGPLCTIADPARASHPINCVTWEMANLYCKAQDKRLPTESEWEYATRGPDGRVYPWGDDAPTAKHLNACGSECVAWGKDHKVALEALYPESDGFPTTAPVGQYEA